MDTWIYVFGLLRLLFSTVFAWLRDVVHPTLLKDIWSVNSPFRRNKTHFWYTAHPCMASKDSTTLGSHPLLHPNSGTLMIKFNSISRFKSSFHQMTNFPPLSLFSIFSFDPRISTCDCRCGNPTEIGAEQAFFTESILSLSEDNNGWYEVLILCSEEVLHLE